MRRMRGAQRFSFAIGRDRARGHLYKALVPPNLRAAQKEWAVRTLRRAVADRQAYYALAGDDARRFDEAAEKFRSFSRRLAPLSAAGAANAEREALNISLAGELYASQGRFLEALELWEKKDAPRLRKTIELELAARVRQLELSSRLGPRVGVNAPLVEEDIQNMRLYLALDSFPEADGSLFDFTVSPYAN